jgi:hypothetical protein
LWLRVGLPPIYDVETSSEGVGPTLNMMNSSCCSQMDIVMWAPPAVSPRSTMFWHSVVAGQLPLRSVLCRAVRGGTVLDHGLGILAGGNRFLYIRTYLHALGILHFTEALRKFHDETLETGRKRL